MHPADGSLPAGQLYHAAGASQDGWTIIAVHDSQSSWETFRDSILMPDIDVFGQHTMLNDGTPTQSFVPATPRAVGKC